MFLKLSKICFRSETVASDSKTKCQMRFGKVFVGLDCDLGDLEKR